MQDYSDGLAIESSCEMHRFSQLILLAQHSLTSEDASALLILDSDYPAKSMSNNEINTLGKVQRKVSVFFPSLGPEAALSHITCDKFSPSPVLNLVALEQLRCCPMLFCLCAFDTAGMPCYLHLHPVIQALGWEEAKGGQVAAGTGLTWLVCTIILSLGCRPHRTHGCVTGHTCPSASQLGILHAH